MSGIKKSGLPPGMPQPTGDVPTASKSANSVPEGGANPYANDEWVSVLNRIPESMDRRLTELVDELVAAGLSKRAANKNQLRVAILHFCMPSDVASAADLIRRWEMLKLAPPASP